MQSHSGESIAFTDVEELVSETSTESYALLDSLSKQYAFEDTANALLDLHGMKKIPIEELIPALKAVYKSQYLEILTREKAAKRLKSER